MAWNRIQTWVSADERGQTLSPRCIPQAGKASDGEKDPRETAHCFPLAAKTKNLKVEMQRQDRHKLLQENVTGHFFLLILSHPPSSMQGSI